MQEYLANAKPIEIPSLNNLCYKQIKEMILCGLIDWGQRIDVGNIATSFGVSKFPVIKAVDKLAQEGLAVVYPNKGTYVATPTLEIIQQVTEIRVMIEEHCLKKAIENDSPELKKKLLKCRIKALNQAEDLSNLDFKEFLSDDREFHTTLVDSANNQRLSEYYQIIRSQTELWRTKTFSLDNILESIRKHIQIIDYICEGNLEKATSTLREHLYKVRSESLETIGENAEV